MHITHRLDIIGLALVQLVLQLFQLGHQHLYLHIKMRDVLTNGINRATLAFNLGIEYHQILKAFLDIPLVVTEKGFLFLDLLLNLLSLVLQGVHSRLRGRAGFPGLSGFTRLTRFSGLSGSSRLFCLGHGSLLRRWLLSCTLFLCIRSQCKD